MPEFRRNSRTMILKITGNLGGCMNFFDVLSLLGGLAMFLYGMRLMGDSLKENSSGTLKRVMERPVSLSADASRVLDILRNETDHALALAKAGKACPEDWKIVVDSVFPRMRNVTVVVDSIRKVEK